MKCGATGGQAQVRTPPRAKYCPTANPLLTLLPLSPFASTAPPSPPPLQLLWRLYPFRDGAGWGRSARAAASVRGPLRMRRWPLSAPSPPLPPFWLVAAPA